MTFWKQIRVLHFKNVCIRRCHWLATLFEILVPVFIFGLMAWVNGKNKVEHFSNKETINSPRSMNNAIRSGFYDFGNTIEIAYAPKNSMTEKITNEVVSILRENTPNDRDLRFNVTSVDSEAAMEDYLIEKYGQGYWVLRAPGFGLYFPNVKESSTNALPEKIECVIRPTSDMFYTTELVRPPNNGFYGPGSTYFSYGFNAVNWVLNEAILRMSVRNTVSVPQIFIEEFPAPEYGYDANIYDLTTFLPTACIFSVMFVFIFLLTYVISEKESGGKELMKMMGLKGWMTWVGWTMAVLTTQIISVTIITILLVAPIFGPAILKSSPLLIWVYLILYVFAAISFAFAFCPLFKRPTIGICVSTIVWGATGYQIQIPKDSYFKFLDNVLFLFPNINLNRGWDSFRYFEGRGGAHWSDFYTTPVDDKYFSLAFVFGIFVLHCVLWGIISWYLGAIWPGPYGIPSSFLFFVKKSYWVRTKKDKDSGNDHWSPESHKNFELVPRDLKPGIQVRHLKKSFKNVTAVNQISINFYQGEITALLGHNGAGKTTTMSMLTGMIPADSGKVIVDDYNIFDNMSRFRQNLGLCPQHNLLFDYLSVMDHLMFFGLLKGLSKEEAHAEASNLMELQGISSKEKSTIDKLSGGMKRKLCLAIALIGNPKILMLDEPTSGMDPESRREIWNLLLSMRGERTIVLTTHFMEEADVLGDRIAIMDHGEIECFGTSLMLKKLYGAGYHLNILKKKDFFQNRDLITSTIQEFIPEAELKSDEGPTLSYTLPTESIDAFPFMFSRLESLKDDLGISSLGVACTTMEEVFLKVGEIAVEEREMNSNGTNSMQEIHPLNSNADADVPKVKHPALLWQQFTALLIKKLKYSYRRCTMYLIFGIVPILASLFSNVLLHNFEESIQKQPVTPLLLDPHTYDSMRVLHRSADTNPYISRLSEFINPHSDVRIPSDDDTVNYLLSLGYKDRNKYYVDNLMAIDVNSTAMVALYNTFAIHSSAVSLNLVYNLLLKTHADKTVSIVNHPISITKRDLCHTNDLQIGLFVFQAFVWIQFFGTALFILIGSFIAFPILERLNNAKQLQLMTGVSPALYWLTIFIVDYSYLILVSLICVFVFVAGGTMLIESALVLCLILALYGLSGMLFSYLISYFKKSNAEAYSLYIKLNLFVGTYGAVIMYGLLRLNVVVNGTLLNKTVVKTIHNVLRLLPQYSFVISLLTFNFTAFQKRICNICSIQDCPEVPEYDGIRFNENMIALLVDSLIYCGIIFLVESGYLAKLTNMVFLLVYGTEIKDGTQSMVDPDVQEEKDKVNSARDHPEHVSDHLLLVDNLAKKFSRSYAAVRGVSFTVRPGECFGLLGVNGAGKTTTFRMITGDTLPTIGDCSIFGLRLSKTPSRYLAQIGYCPQFDGINDFLTGGEMLQLFAQLRGVHRAYTTQQITKWVSTLGLAEYAHNLCKTYSGGNKRKLSTAMSLIGDPSLVILDEPTSGVDPISRRRLWDVLAESRKRGQAIVFTSHSMDECEALCDRLTIMVAGKMMCIGNVEYLKQRYAQGYSILIKLGAGSDSERDALKRTVKEAFGEILLKDEHVGLLNYHITAPTVALSELFSKMRAIKECMSVVEDYQVCNTTLEQVFLAFARDEAKIIER